MKATTEERWRGHVMAWSASGRTCRDYAARAGVNPRTLTWWKSKLKESTAARNGPSFVEVTEQLGPPATPIGEIELEVGGVRVRVRGQVETEALSRVLAALEVRTSPVREHERRSPGRRPLPEHLPRVEIEILPPEVQQAGLDAFKRIGQEVQEVLERRPASMVVVRLVRPKFIRKDELDALETRVVVAEAPERPIDRGLAGPGMLAMTVVHRWQDMQPLNRLESIYARDGLDIARSTLCGWHEQLADIVEPVVDAMQRDAFEQPYLCTDATGVLVQAKEQCQRAHFWVLVAPERHVLSRFSHKHDGKAVDRLLAGYKGFLVADAATVFDHLWRVTLFARDNDVTGHVIYGD